MSVEFQSGFDELMKARRASVGEKEYIVMV